MTGASSGLVRPKEKTCRATSGPVRAPVIPRVMGERVMDAMCEIQEKDPLDPFVGDVRGRGLWPPWG